MKKIGSFWLMKSEPSELSIDDLKRKKRWHWDGVRNYEARNFMRDHMQIGDLILFYHSNGTPSGVAGIAKVDSRPYADFTQFNIHSKYFDPKATPEKPRWFMVDIAFVKHFPQIIPRESLRSIATLQGMKLWTRPRLSIIPLTKKEFNAIFLFQQKYKKDYANPSDRMD